ncbi:MAG: hypothetical protein ACK4IS_02465 [Erythrobacter sp.]
MTITAIPLAAALALLAGCSSEKSGTITTPEGESADYTIDEATGETTMRIKTPAGEATMRSGAAVPVNLPDGFTLYPGSEVVTNTVVNQPDGASTMVVFEAPGEAGAIIAHFRQAATKAGYAIEIEATMKDTMMLSGKRAGDGTSFMVSTGAKADGKTSGQLVIGNGKGG